LIQLAYLYAGISFALAMIVAIGVIIAPRGQRLELAVWGAIGSTCWFVLFLAVLVEKLIEAGMRFADRFFRP